MRLYFSIVTQIPHWPGSRKILAAALAYFSLWLSVPRAAAQETITNGVAQATTLVNGATVMVPLPGATVRVCVDGSVSVPCSAATIFTDRTGGTSATNPFTADSSGNYTFYAAPGWYNVQISAPGLAALNQSVFVPTTPASPNSSTGNNQFKYINNAKHLNGYSTCNGSGTDRANVQTALNDAAGSTLILDSGYNCVNDGTLTWTVPANTTVACADATSKFTMSASTNNFAMFTLGGNNIQFLNCNFVSTVAFNNANLAYAFFWTGKNNITFNGGSCTGFSFACFGAQDSVGQQFLGSFNCSNNGSQNDGAGHHEGRCITFTTTGATPNKAVVISGWIMKNNGSWAVISDGAVGGSCAYSLDGFTFAVNDIEFNGDSGIQLNNAQNGTMTANTSSHNGQNTVTNFGEGLHTYGVSSNGSLACPDNNITITGNTTTFNRENGIEVGFGSNNETVSGNTTCHNGSAITGTGFGIKVSDVATDIGVTGNVVCFNNVDGILVSATATQKSDGVTNGTTTFTSATAAFVAGDVGKNITIQNGNTGSAVYFGTIASRTNGTTVVLSVAPTSSASGLTFFYGFYQHRITIAGNHVHDNNQTGINVFGGFDIKVEGGESYRNGLTTGNRYGVLCAEVQRCIVRGVNTFDDQAVPTQQFGVAGAGSDQVTAEQITGYGNVSGLITLNNGSSTNSVSDTGTGNLVRGTSPALNGTTIVGTPASGNLSATVGSGTGATAGTAIGAGTSQTLAITVSGALTTDVAQCGPNTAYPATWLTGITVLAPVVTANTVTLTITNPSAGSITPAAQTFRCTVTR